MRRGPDDLAYLRNPRVQERNNTLFAALLILALVILGWALQSEFGKWRNLGTKVPIQRSSWKVLFSDAGCDKKFCLAAPENKTLWTTTLTRNDPSYRALLAKRKAAPVWTGTWISPEDVKKAQSENANVLFLGRIYAKYSLWINGEAADTADGVIGTPVFLNLREKEWANPRGIYIAIRFENLNNYHSPELTVFEMGQIGFMSATDKESLIQFMAFDTWGRPLTFGALNLLICLFFFIFWRTEPLKQEYLWFSGYTFLHGITQILTIVPIIVWLGPIDAHLKLGLKAWEVSLPLLLGLSFSRCNRRVLQTLLLITLGSSLIIMLSGTSPIVRLLTQQWLSVFGTTLAALLGSAFCLAEYFWGDLPRKRQYRLLSFSVGLMLIGVLYYLNGQGIASDSAFVFWHRLAHLCLTVVLALIVFADYKELAQRSQKMPLTKWHQDERNLNKPVLGTIINFDLKRSELLTSHRESGLSPREILNRAVYPFRLILAEFQGQEISCEGDGMLVFFPEEILSLERVIKEVIPTVISKRLPISVLLQSDGISPPSWKFNFRMAINYSSIVPVIEKFDQEEKAHWSDGPDRPLTESARLLEIDKSTLDPKRETTSILFSKSVERELMRRNSLTQLQSSLGTERRVEAKHDIEWKFLVKFYDDLKVTDP